MNQIESILKIRAEGQAELAKIERAYDMIAAAGNKTAAAGASAFKQLVAGGDSYDKALKQITRSQDLFGSAVSKVAKGLLDETKELDKQAKQLAANERGWRQLQAAHEAALKEQGRMDAAAARSLAQQEAAAKRLAASAGTDASRGARGAAMGLGIPGGMALRGGPMLAAGFAAGAIIKEIKDLVTEYANYGREITNLSTRTGLSIQETQLWSKAAKVAGVDANAMVQAVRGLSKALAENSDEGKRAKNSLKELGLDESVAFQSPDAAAKQIFGRLNQLPNGFDKDRITQNIFGRGGLNLLPMADQLDKLLPRLRALGVALDDDGVKKADAFKTELELLGLQWDALRLRMGENIVGKIQVFLGDKDLGQGAAHYGAMGLATLMSGGNTGVGAAVGALKNIQDKYSLSPSDIVKSILTGQQPSENFTPNMSVAEMQGMNPERFKPQVADPAAITRAAVSKRIQEILNSASDPGKTGRVRSLERQLKDVQSDEASTLDSASTMKDVSTVAGDERKIAGLKQQIYYEGEILRIKKETFAIEQQDALKNFGPAAPLEARRRESLRDLDEQITQARGAGQPKEVSELTEQRDKRNKYYNDEIERVVQKTADAQKQALSSVDVETQKAGLERQSNRALRIGELQASGRPGGMNESDVTKATEIRKKLTQDIYDVDRKHIEETVFAEGFVENINKKQLALKEAAGAQTKANANIDIDAELKVLEIEKRRQDRKDAADREIRNIGTNAERTNIIRQSTAAGRRNQLADVGNPGQAIIDTYHERMSLAKQLFAEDMKNAAAEDDIDKRREDSAKALADLKKATGDAQIEKELQILELQKQEADKFKSFSGSFFDALEKRGNALPQLFRTYGLGIAKTMFENAGQEAYGMFKKSGASVSVPGQQNQDGSLNWIGKFLKGTPFGVDPVKQAQADNTTAVKTNVTALGTLTTSIDSLDQAIMALMQAYGISPDGTWTGGGPQGPGGLGALPGLGGFPSLGGIGSPQDNIAGILSGLSAPGSSSIDNMPLGNMSDTALAALGLPGSADTSSVLAGAAGGAAAVGALTGIASMGKQLLSGAASIMPHAVTGGGTQGGLFAGIYNNDNMSGAQIAGNTIASAGAVATGAITAINQFAKGGARGALGGVSSILGVASMIPGPQQPFIMAASLITGLVKSLLPDPRVERGKEITNELIGARANLPNSVNVVESANNGNQVVSDFRGNLRTLNAPTLLQAFQQVTGVNPTKPSNLLTQTQYLPNYGAQQDAAMLAPNKVPAPAVTNVHVTPQITVSTMDAKSFSDNHAMIGDAVLKSLQSGGRLRSGITNTVKPF